VNDTEKQIVEQVAGAITGTADLASMIVTGLVAMKKVTPDEGLTLLERMSDHVHDLSKRNAQAPGMALAFRQIADRIDKQIVELKKGLAGR
jgi:hypothetical protein